MKSSEEIDLAKEIKLETKKEIMQNLPNQKEDDNLNLFKFFFKSNFDIIRSRIKSIEDFKKHEELEQKGYEPFMKTFNQISDFRDYSTQVKSALRSGIPNEFKREFILKLFEVKSNDSKLAFEIASQSVFSSNASISLDHVPTFTHFSNFEEALPIKFLKEEQIISAKKILWLINQQYSIEYSPLLMVTVCLLLLFLHEYEVFDVIRKLIDKSFKENNSPSIRWHFTFKNYEFGKLVNAYLECYSFLSKKKGKENVEHFSKIGFNPQLLIASMIGTMFLEYVQFHQLIKIFMLYLHEGTKILFRFCYAIMKKQNKLLLKIDDKDKIIPELTMNSINEIEDTEYLLYWAFKLRLTSKNNKFYEQQKQNIDFTCQRSLNLLKVNIPSKIISFEDIIFLMSKIDYQRRMCDWIQAFSTSINGYSFITMYNECSKYLDAKGMFFILKNSIGEVIGGFCGNIFQLTELNFIGNSESFLFKMYPKEKRKIWKFAGENSNVLNCEKSKFIFGSGGKGPAITVANNFENCAVNECETFMNEQLLESSEFKCLEMEIYSLK